MNRLKKFEDCLLRVVIDGIEHELRLLRMSDEYYDIIQKYTDVYCDLSEATNGGYTDLYSLLEEELLVLNGLDDTPLSSQCYFAIKSLKTTIREAKATLRLFHKDHGLNKTYFISGHRDITQEEFDKYYKPAILNIVDTDFTCKFVVGDYHGVDTMAQQLLSDLCSGKRRKISPKQVTVYHMFEKPRNFVNEKFNLSGGYTSDEERDAAMTHISDEDVAFVRKGKYTSGTAQNVVRRHTFE